MLDDHLTSKEIYCDDIEEIYCDVIEEIYATLLKRYTLRFYEFQDKNKTILQLLY